jgi:hypothetical protein
MIHITGHHICSFFICSVQAIQHRFETCPYEMYYSDEEDEIVKQRKAERARQIEAEQAAISSTTGKKMPPSLKRSMSLLQQQDEKAAHEGKTPHYRPYDWTKFSDFEQFGVGVWLYFKFLVKLYRVFFFLALMTIPTLLVCYNGKSLSNGVSVTKQVDSFTIGNIGTTINATMVTLPWIDQTYEKTSIANYMAGIDWAAAAILLLFIWFHSREEESDTQDADDRSLTAADYTLKVLNLPPYMPEAELRLKLRDWFEAHGYQVYDGSKICQIFVFEFFVVEI